MIESNPTSTIVSKVWSFCNTLRDDGVGYGDYLEQLTYLLFLKMADEYSKPPLQPRRCHPPRLQLGQSLRGPERRRTRNALHSPCCVNWAKKGIWGRFSPRAKTRSKTPPNCPDHRHDRRRPIGS
jgi:type I restriction enzyme M protein